MFKPVYPVVADRVVFMAASGSSFVQGDLVVREVGTGRVQPAVATLANATIIEGIAKKTGTVTAGDPIEVIFIQSGMLLEADTTNATAANQLGKAHLLTDAATVNNTSTHSTDIDAVFIALQMSGTTSANKLIGYIAKLGQVTA